MPNVGNISSVVQQYISPTANVVITSVGNTPCNIYSMHNASISALPSTSVTTCNSMTAVPSVCTSTSHSGVSSVPSVGTFLSAPSVPNMDTTYMGMSSASVIAPHGISQKTAEQTVTGQYVDLSEFLPPLASSNIMNKTELEPYLDGSENLSYRPKKSKRKIHNFDNWVEAWSHYEKLVIKYVGVGCHEAFVDYHLFMAECNKKYSCSWYCIAMYDFKHRVKLANSTTLFDRLQFDKVNMDLFPTILDSTAIQPNTASLWPCECQGVSLSR